RGPWLVHGRARPPDPGPTPRTRCRRPPPAAPGRRRRLRARTARPGRRPRHPSTLERRPRPRWAGWCFQRARGLLVKPPPGPARHRTGAPISMLTTSTSADDVFQRVAERAGLVRREFDDQAAATLDRNAHHDATSLFGDL